MYTGFLLGAGNRLFIPSIHVNVTGYCEKNVSEITETTFKIHRILKKTHPCFGNFLSTNSVIKHVTDNITMEIHRL